MSETKLTPEQLVVGKIYFLDYGGNTQILGRFKSHDATKLYFFDILHYWNGYESFKHDEYTVKSGLEAIREATKPEKHTIVRLEIENNCI